MLQLQRKNVDREDSYSMPANLSEIEKKLWSSADEMPGAKAVEV